jgi:HK97 family phage portal protein
LAFWDRFTKQETETVSATVPLVPDVSGAQYPTANYENFASEGYGKNEIVHACIRELATAAASPRYYVQRNKAGGLVEADPATTPLGQLFARPNSQDDMYSWIEKFVTHLYVSGNVYVLKERDRANRVINLWLLRPDRVSIKPGDMQRHTYLYTIDGREYQIPPDDIAHMAFPNPSGDVYGLSPLSVLSRIVNLDLAMTDFAKTFFQNAGVPSGLLKVKKRIGSAEEAGVIRARWRSTFGGTNNMHRVAILDDDAEYQAMAAAPKDMDLTGLHYLTESRICSVFGVPPIIISANVGLARSTYANYKEARLSFHSETVEPLISRIIRFLNNAMAPEFGSDYALAVDFSAVLSPLDDSNEQANRISMLYQAGVITLNEARGYIGQANVDGGEEFIAVGVSFGTDLKPDLGARAVQDAKQLKAPQPSDRAIEMNARLLESREAEVLVLEPQLDRHYRILRDRVSGILGRLMERSHGAEEVKDVPGSADELIPPGATTELAEILRNSYMRVTRGAYQVIDDAGIVGAVEWSDKSPVVTGILTSVNGRANMIHSTTKKYLQKAIEIAMTRGYTVEQLARGVPKENFPGVRSLMSETKIRARLIARTEIMRSQNLTTTRLYAQQGFNFVTAVDIDGGKHDNYIPPEDPFGFTCAQRDGTVYRTEDAENIMDHPNGTLSWMPMPSNFRG